MTMARTILATTALILFGATATSTQTAAGVADLRLTLTAQAPRVVLGEPVGVTITVTNPTARPIEVTARAEPESGLKYGLLHVFIAKPNEDFRRFRGPRWGTGARPEAAALAPGASFNIPITLFQSESAPGHEAIFTSVLPFSAPGRYRIKAVWHDGDFAQQTASPEISIEVAEPQGDDAGVWEAVKGDPDLAEIIQSGRPHVDDPATTKLLSLLQRFPASKAAQRPRQ